MEPRPGSAHCAAWVRNPAEFTFIDKRGYVLIDHQIADVVGRDDPQTYDPVRGFMRFLFREPYQDYRA